MRKALLAASAAVAVIAVIALILESGGGGGGGGSSAQPPLPPAKRITGPLHTDGKQVVGADGPVRMLGLDEPGLVSGSGNNRLTEPDSCGDGYLPVPDTEFDDFRRFGFNSVRLGSRGRTWSPMRRRRGAARVERQYLRRSTMRSRGSPREASPLILDMHANNLSPAFKNPKPDRCRGQRPAGVAVSRCGQSQDSAEAECEFLSGEPLPGAPSDAQQGTPTPGRSSPAGTRDNKLVVAADIFNEPSAANCPGLDMLPFYEQIGTAIRQADPKLLLIYQDNAARSGNYAAVLAARPSRTPSTRSTSIRSTGARASRCCRRISTMLRGGTSPCGSASSACSGSRAAGTQPERRLARRPPPDDAGDAGPPASAGPSISTRAAAAR